MPAKWGKLANEKKNFFNSLKKTLKEAAVPDTLCRGVDRRGQKLRMVRLASEIGVQDLLAVRFVVVFARRFGGYEDRVDLG